MKASEFGFKFNIGDVVRLKSGGNRLVVRARVLTWFSDDTPVREYQTAETNHALNGQIVITTIPETSLEKVEDKC